MKNKINIIGWMGLIIALTACFTMTSCKKDKSIEPTPTPTTTPLEIEGGWTFNGTSSALIDSVYIYKQGTHYYMTCPEYATYEWSDTIEIINCTNTTFEIPEQAIHGDSFTITGSGYLAGGNMYLSFVVPTHNYTNLLYYRL